MVNIFLMSRIVDQELSVKIQSELDMEKETRDPDNIPASISDFLYSSSFEVGLSSPLA